MESAFRAVKSVFDEYNKWNEHGIVLLFNNMDMARTERLVEIRRTTIPWADNMHILLVRHLHRGCFDSGEANSYPTTTFYTAVKAAVMHDITNKTQCLV